MGDELPLQKKQYQTYEKQRYAILVIAKIMTIPAHTNARVELSSMPFLSRCPVLAIKLRRGRDANEYGQIFMQK